MSRGRFAFLMAMTFVAVAAIKAALPFIVLSTNICSGGREGCGVLAIIVGMFGGYGAVIIFIGMMVKIFYRRVSSVGLSRLWVVLVFLLAWGSSQVIYGTGNFWGANFSVGLIFMQFPYMLIALIGFGIFLALYAPPVGGELPSGHRKAWTIAACSAVAVWVTSSLFAMFFLAALGGRLGLPLHALLPMTSLGVFFSALTYLLVVSTDGKGDGPKHSPKPASRAQGAELPRATFGRRGT